MTTIKHLNQIANEPNINVVACLEDLLEQAKTGDLVGIAITTLHKGNETGFGFAGTFDPLIMLGASEMTRTKLLNMLLRTEE